MLPSRVQAGGTRERQVSILLDIMGRRTDEHFKTFINALVIGEQEEFAKMLDRDVALPLICARNLNRKGSANVQGTVILSTISVLPPSAGVQSTVMSVSVCVLCVCLSTHFSQKRRPEL